VKSPGFFGVITGVSGVLKTKAISEDGRFRKPWIWYETVLTEQDIICPNYYLTLFLIIFKPHSKLH